MTLRAGPRAVRIIALLIAALAPRAAAAQDSSRLFVPAGGPLERELRAWQLVEQSRTPRIWSVRAFNAAETGALRHRDSSRRDLNASERSAGRLRWNVLPTEAGTIVNTGYPFGFNDGALWAGRGFTGFAKGGVHLRVGRVSARLNPAAFISQNAPFAPAVDGAFVMNSHYATNIDLPDRFGTGAYGRFDPGESELRIQGRLLAGGLSTASQVWGPAAEHPVILGNNAGGFPHAFLESAKPIDIRFATVHGRLIWGRVDASAYRAAGSQDRNFVTGAVGVVAFPALPGLELGATRFFHMPWPADGIFRAPFLSVFQGLLKSSLTTSSNPEGDVPGDNQLASVFIRWAFPGSGVEVYGEYGREDHNGNLRDFWEEIDHDAAFLVGAQRAWRPGKTTLRVLRLEHLNTRMGKLHPVRAQAPWYIHGTRVQGHTHRGQLLGSAGGFGGGATSVAVDQYGTGGRTTVRWDRIMRAEKLETEALIPVPGKADVFHAVGGSHTWRRGSRELELVATAVFELNRNFRGDAFNLSSAATYRLFR